MGVYVHFYFEMGKKFLSVGSIQSAHHYHYLNFSPWGDENKIEEWIKELKNFPLEFVQRKEKKYKIKMEWEWNQIVWTFKPLNGLWKICALNKP